MAVSAETWTCTACGTVHPIDHTGMWCGACRAIVLCAGCERRGHQCPDDFIAWSDQLAYLDCDGCSLWTGHPEACPGCDGQGYRVVYLGTFFANLAIAAGLSACAEAMKLRRRMERAAAIVRDFREDIERASRWRATRGAGGQHVSPTHTFAAISPSGLSEMHRVARELTMATSGAEVSLAAKDPT